MGDIKKRWQYVARNWIGAKSRGLLLVAARPFRKGRWLKPWELPREVSDYLNLESGNGTCWCIEPFKTIESILKCRRANARRVDAMTVKGTVTVGFKHLAETEAVKSALDIHCLEWCLRLLDEGRNMKRYHTTRKGLFTCPTEKNGQYLMYPPPGKEPKIAKCARCKKEHPVTWVSETSLGDGCFNLTSFGWKDADLDPEGCTGIDEILGVEDGNVLVKVSGHKTAGDPTHESECDLTEEDERMFSEEAHEVVCGGWIPGTDGDWTGDDWSLSYREVIRVPVVYVLGRIDYETLARNIVAKAREALKPIQAEWALIDKGLDSICADIRKKYDKKKPKS